MVLVFDKLVDQTSSIGRWDLLHNAFYSALTSLELFYIVLEILSVDILLLSFNVLPAFGALLSFKSEQGELGIIVGEAVLRILLALHASLLAHCRVELLRGNILSLLTHVLDRSRWS